jgi:hypothetical protein
MFFFSSSFSFSLFAGLLEAGACSGRQADALVTTVDAFPRSLLVAVRPLIPFTPGGYDGGQNQDHAVHGEHVRQRGLQGMGAHYFFCLCP